MKVLKFGGTSVKTPDRIRHVSEIILANYQEFPLTVAVLSAFGGVTDQLLALGEKAAAGDEDYLTLFAAFRAQHETYARELLGKDDPSLTADMAASFTNLSDVLHGVYLVKECSPRIKDFLVSFGERFSCRITSAYLQKQQQNCHYIDARKLIRTDNNFGNARVNFAETNRQITDYFRDRQGIFIVTGFIGSTEEDETTTLGRGGSDYTTAIFGAALEATEIEIWTDVNGVMTADPRKVPEAFSLTEITYEEAMELSHFGAKVIHPPTMQPALKANIPIRIRNTFQVDFPGTKVCATPDTPAQNGHQAPFITGITSISDVCLIRIEGSGMIGVAGIAMRLFGTLAQGGINIILITQGSSEHSITFAISPAAASVAQSLIEAEFQLEIMAGRLEAPVVEKDLSIIAVVGEKMRHTTGIAGKVFQALGRNNINIVAIAQGSSELNISMVIHQSDEKRAVQSIHSMFFQKPTRELNLFIAGCGLIGSTLISQIKTLNERASMQQHTKLRIIGIANSQKMIFEPGGINLESWEEQLNNSSKPSDLKQLPTILQQSGLANIAFVDCSASDIVSAAYQEMLTREIHIVTANKKAAAGDYNVYQTLKETAQNKQVSFLYETNVGAGLPVIRTIQDLVKSGDRIHKIEAILSGTLSYIFNQFTVESDFSKIVKQAQDNGYTEPDPREDLNGNDVARKILILAREAGYPLAADDVKIENLVPENARDAETVDSFFVELEKADQRFKAATEKALQSGKVLRYIATYANGKAMAALQAVDETHPFYNLSGSDNIVAINSDRYSEQPLVVRGPGAGAEVTAGGVLADIIRIGETLFS